MKAIIQHENGGPEVLILGEALDPKPGPGELRIRVAATALNRADLLQRRGLYPPPEGASKLLGLEVAGVVDSLGPETKNSGFKPGDRVCALLAGGGYAEYVCVNAGLVMPIPKGMPFAEAAAIPEAWLTAWQTLTQVGNVKAGEKVLVHAGASGVGLAAIQLARELGCTVYATASGAKLDICRKAGATEAFDYRADDFLNPLMEATDNQGVDLILEFVGAPYIESDLKALRTDGRIVLIGLMGGRTLEKPLDLGMILHKRISIIGTTLRARSLDYKKSLISSFWGFAEERLKDNRLDPVIHAIYPWEQVQQAHQLMERNQNTGKIVLALPFKS
ncbi:MAG: NAD(P)H-quinone oxidoreductase [Bacteroidia bacterium]